MRVFAEQDRSFSELSEGHRWSIPARFNISEACCEQHQGHGGDVAVFCESESGGERRFTFAELKSLSDRLAGALRALGVERGDRVAIVLPQCAETAIAHLAIYKIGAVALPLSILFGADALAYRLADSGAKALVFDKQQRSLVESLRGELSELESLICLDHRDPGQGFWNLVENSLPITRAVTTHSDDPALLIYTSGTTGPPKGALIAHRSLWAT